MRLLFLFMTLVLACSVSMADDFNICTEDVSSDHVCNFVVDGSNDTIKVQEALDLIDDLGGGTLYFIGTTFFVDAVTHLNVHSNTTLVIGEGTVIEAIPTDSPNYAVIGISNAYNISIRGGGTIRGERDNHFGSTGEWGHGIQVLGGENILIENIVIEDMWGDGVYIGAGSKNVRGKCVKSRNNRRQGMSITDADHVYFVASEFTGTNGTSPQSGVDVEPNAGSEVNDFQCVECLFSDNAGRGIVISSHTAGNINDVIIKKSISKDNVGSGVEFIGGVNNSSVEESSIYDNRGHGVFVTGGVADQISIEDNLIYANGQTITKSNIHLYQSEGVKISGNTIRVGSNAEKPDYGVRVYETNNSAIIDNDLRNAGDIAAYSEYGSQNNSFIANQY